MMNIGITGCAGRMGRMLLSTVLESPNCTLSGGSERPGSSDANRDIGLLLGLAAPLNLLVETTPNALFERSDAIIDFTTPAATMTHLLLAVVTNTAMIVGTTGLSADEEAILHRAGKSIPIVYAPNFSIGVNLLLALTERVAGILGDDCDIEILEMHHRHKVDAPSGTALGLGRAAAEGRKVALEQVWCKSRDGHMGPRPRGEIGFSTLRGGDVVGDHTVMFATEGERIELTHKASHRAVFAKGAIRAACWVRGKPAGVYRMRDVLGL